MPPRKDGDDAKRGFAVIAANIVAAFLAVGALLLVALYHWSAP